MRRPLVHSLIAWLCLFAFGFDMAVHAMQPIVCDSGGDERVEWVCDKDERGSCLRLLATEDVSDHRAEQGLPPCEDRPVGDDHDQAHHLLAQVKQNGHADLVLPPVMMAILPSFLLEPRVPCEHPTVDQRVRPPDSLARMRTIILNV
ncbi:MAG: hypothetical protein Q8L55_14650 [Phycisphaerales bacterium]|nr:hypothetical protein [Phycisphaerales bacterium]